jgi:hypothetical protein
MRASAWPLAMHAVFLFYMVEGSVPFSELVDERLWDELKVPSASDCHCVCTCARARVRVCVYHVRALTYARRAAAAGVERSGSWGRPGVRMGARRHPLQKRLPTATTDEVNYVDGTDRRGPLTRSVEMGVSSVPGTWDAQVSYTG